MSAWYRRLSTAFLLAVCLTVPPQGGHAEGPGVPKQPSAWVVDGADVIAPADEQRLNAYLSELERKTTAQLVVLTLPSLEGRAIEDLSIETAHDLWGLGQKGQDNGVLLTVAVADRKYRIEVGYGLEGILPDSLVGSIGRDYLVPFFRQGNYAGGIIQAISAMGSLIAEQAGVTLSASPPPVIQPNAGSRRRPSVLSNIFSLLVFVVIMLFVMRNPGLALAFLLGSAMGGRRSSGFGHGPFGGGGGGFGGGGGGGFGGGGASGGW